MPTCLVHAHPLQFEALRPEDPNKEKLKAKRKEKKKRAKARAREGEVGVLASLDNIVYMRL